MRVKSAFAASIQRRDRYKVENRQYCIDNDTEGKEQKEIHDKDAEDGTHPKKPQLEQ